MKKILLLIVLTAIVQIVYSYENTYAIIVGVADYKNFTAYDGDLTWTINDANKFYAFLRSKQGGSVPAENIVLLTDSRASKANIIAKARTLFSKAKTNDRVIFFFSGHGGRGCFVPYDADWNGNNMLYFSEIKSFFRFAKCTTKLLFADACFSGSMKKKIAENIVFKEKVEKSVKLSSNLNIAVMMSCQGDETSLELSELRQGLFTYYLIQGLGGKANRDGSKYVTIQELYYYVYHKVSDKAASKGEKQTPELFGTFDLRLIVGKI